MSKNKIPSQMEACYSALTDLEAKHCLLGGNERLKAQNLKYRLKNLLEPEPADALIDECRSFFLLINGGVGRKSAFSQILELNNIISRETA